MEFHDIEAFACPVRKLLERERTKSLILRKINDYKPKIKEDAFAECLRSKGNDLFKCKNLSESVLLYTKSIGSSKPGSKQLSLGYANRSAALLELGLYEDSLKDLNLALSGAYPFKLRPKLMLRKAELLCKTNAASEAKSLLVEIEEILNTSRAELGNDYARYSSKLIEVLKSLEGYSKNTETAEWPKPELETNHFVEHSTIKAFSKKLSFHTSEKKGRYLKSAYNIEKGEVLIKEDPYVFIVLPEYLHSYCANCLLKSFSLICCEFCPETFWCSERCKAENWKMIHQYECGYVEFIESTGIGRLALHALLKSGKQKVLSCVKETESHKKINNRDLNKIVDGYSSVFQLVTHLSDVEEEDLHQFSFTCALLLTFLESKSKFFLEDSLPVAHKEVDIIGGVLLKHLLQLICNSHAITGLSEYPSTLVKETSVRSVSQIKIASAIYPMASLMNHSCEPNIISSFLGPCLFVKAVVDIAQDDEILNCYGPHFRRHSRLERQCDLKQQYHFTCECLRCLEDLSEVVPECIKDESKPCGRIRDAVSRAESCIECGNAREALGILLVSESQHKTSQCTNFELLNDIRDNIGKCFAILGNYRKSVEYVDKCQPFVISKYGPNSIEVGYELLKLVDLYECLMLKYPNDKSLIDKIIEHLSAAKTIFELHYGNWSQPFKEVEEKLSGLTIQDGKC